MTDRLLAKVPDPPCHRLRLFHLDAEHHQTSVTTNPKHGPLRRPSVSGTWRYATESAGLTGFHFRDLRHTGNHIAAATGASPRELMGRMDHSSTRAALIYQHRMAERDRNGTA
jgi:integrase